VWPELTEAAAAARLPISLTYGMTETAAMIAGIKPADFLAGERTWAEPFPRARIRLTPQEVIQVDGPSVFLGYWPDLRLEQTFDTADLGRMDSRGRLQVLGRRDAIIITGGKKVQPLDVEAALRATGEFVDVSVIGRSDRVWGQEVVACYPRSVEAAPDLASVQRQIERTLSPHQRPKRYVAIEDWPRTEQGKLNRLELLRRVEERLR
jgi:O-succinylbenzoic acid--CoA ligase